MIKFLVIQVLLFIMCSFPDIGRAATLIHTVTGASGGDQLGFSVGSLGDINLDGYNDFVIGTPLHDEGSAPDAGRAQVLSGFDASILYTFTGSSFQQYMGWDVGAAGDVDNDGYPDIIVGVPHNDVGGSDEFFNSGSAIVYSGKAGTVLHIFSESIKNREFGSAVSGAGDVNGDGHDDLIVGGIGNFDPGQVRIYSGADGGLLRSFTAGSNGDRKGTSVGSVGDLNMDGYDEVIFGTPGDDDGPTDSGTVTVYDYHNDSLVFSFPGLSAGERLGQSVAGVGDVNGDGVPDFAAGSHLDSANGSEAGKVTVFSGFDAAVIYTFLGDSANDWFGWSVDGIGDVNADGRPDVLVGSRHGDYAKVFSGLDGGVLHLLTGGGRFGYDVAGLGDVNGDGGFDYIVGANLDDAGGANAGAAFVYAGEAIPVPEPSTWVSMAGLVGVIGLCPVRGKKRLAARKVDKLDSFSSDFEME